MYRGRGALYKSEHLLFDVYYGLSEFCNNVVNKLDNSCGYCDLCWLEKSAIYAKENGQDKGVDVASEIGSCNVSSLNQNYKAMKVVNNNKVTAIGFYDQENNSYLCITDSIVNIQTNDEPQLNPDAGLYDFVAETLELEREQEKKKNKEKSRGDRK